MNQIPEPLTPPECDLRSMTFMPLEVIRVLQSTTFVKSTGDEFKAAFALWCASWLEVPAASLPNDEVMLSEFSRSKKWKKVREVAMRGWILCSDGRLYHPTIAKVALTAWDRRLDFQETTSNKSERQKRWREHCKDLSDKLRSLGIVPPSGASLEVLEKLLAEASVDGKASTTPSTVDNPETGMTETVRGTETETGTVKGQTPSVPTGTGAEAPDLGKAAAEMTKQELWSAGKSLLKQGGMPAAQCGSFVGKLVSDYGDAIVVEAVRSAVVEQPADPASFLKACCQKRKGERNTGPDDLAARQDASNAEAKRLLGIETGEVIDV